MVTYKDDRDLLSRRDTRRFKHVDEEAYTESMSKPEMYGALVRGGSSQSSEATEGGGKSGCMLRDDKPCGNGPSDCWKQAAPKAVA
jgi:hypothetical protein